MPLNNISQNWAIFKGSLGTFSTGSKVFYISHWLLYLYTSTCLLSIKCLLLSYIVNGEIRLEKFRDHIKSLILITIYIKTKWLVNNDKTKIPLRTFYPPKNGPVILPRAVSSTLIRLLIRNGPSGHFLSACTTENLIWITALSVVPASNSSFETSRLQVQSTLCSLTFKY